MAYVYRHIRLDKNEPFYIGIGSDNKYQRAHTHKNRNLHWKNIINITEYRVDILIDDIDYEQAKLKEQEFIKIYGRVDTKNGILCNLTDGGDGQVGFIVSEEIRKKRSEAYKGDKFRKENNSFYGKKHTEETKRKISLKKIGQSYKGHKHTEEQKLKNSQRQKGNKNRLGKIHSEETREKMSLKAKGRIPWNKGKIGIYSEETLKKISESSKGRVPVNKGIPLSESAKINLSEKLKGKSAFWNIGNTYNKGKIHTEETKLKISQKNIGKKHTDESRSKMSLSHKGKKQSKELIEKRILSIKKTLLLKKELNK